MEEKELRAKQEKIVMLSMEICRLRKILGIKQRQYNEMDTQIYNALKEKENEKDISEDNK